MNALLLTSSLSRDGGGVFTALQGLVPALGARGMQVALHGLRDAGWALDAASWQPENVVAHEVRGPGAFGWAPGMNQAVSAAPADIVHCHGHWKFPSVQARRVQRRRQIPLVVSPHGMLNRAALEIAGLKKKIALAAYERDHVMNAQCLHALVDTELEELRRFGYRGPICVIPNGVPAPASPTDVPPPWAALDANIPGDAPVLLYIGRKHPVKNIAGLLQAWQQLVSAGQTGKWHLVVGGWGSAADEAALQAQFNEAGLSSAHCLGPVFGAGKIAALQNAAGFALVSRNEGLPVAVLEAWAYGLPAFLSQYCNLDIGYQHGAAMAAPVEPEPMAQALRQFIAMPESERLAMGERGRKLVQTNYQWDSVAAQFEAVYQWLVHGGARPDCVEPALP